MSYGGLLIVFYLYMSRYVDLPLSKSFKKLMETDIFKYMFLITLIYTGTKDIIQTMFLFCVILLFRNFILKKKSNFCLKSKLTEIIDDNGDGKASNYEIDKVIKVLETMKNNSHNIDNS